MNNQSRDHWGKHLWGFLHTISISDSEIPEDNLRVQKPIKDNIKMLSNIIPCQICKSDFIKNLPTIDNLDLYKSKVLFYWTVDFHNKINNKLNKEEITYKEAEKIWFKDIE